MVRARSAKSWPASSSRKTMGRKMATVVAVEASSAPQTWPGPVSAASFASMPARAAARRSPAPRWPRPGSSPPRTPSRQGNDVDGPAGEVQEDERREQRHRDRDRHQQRGAQLAQEPPQHPRWRASPRGRGCCAPSRSSGGCRRSRRRPARRSAGRARAAPRPAPPAACLSPAITSRTFTPISRWAFTAIERTPWRGRSSCDRRARPRCPRRRAAAPASPSRHSRTISPSSPASNAPVKRRV